LQPLHIISGCKEANRTAFLKQLQRAAADELATSLLEQLNKKNKKP